MGSDTHHKQLEEWKNGRRTTLKQGNGQSILILMPPPWPQEKDRQK